MKTKFALLIFVALAFCLSCCTSSAPTSKLEEVMGKQTYETIRSADSIIFCEVNISGGIEGTEEFKHCKTVPDAMAKEISKMVANEENYLFGVAKTNLFYPQATLIFKHKNHQVALQVNTTSSQFRITVDGKEKVLEYSPMKRLFDENIQTLKQ